MRTKPSAKSSVVRDSKHRDMAWVLENVILAQRPPAALTSFVLREEEVFLNLVQQIRSSCPLMFRKFEHVFSGDDRSDTWQQDAAPPARPPAGC